MSEAKFTPGPWFCPEQAEGIVVTTDGGIPLFYLPLWEPDLTTCRANAALIAASPDLVKAMQRIEPYLDAIVCYASTCGEHEPNAIVRDFRAALSKALGDSK